MDKKEKSRKKSPARVRQYGATERCRAVLSVWTERRKPSQVCRELEIHVSQLTHWQQRALEGMLQALEPRAQLAAGAALSPRLQAMLERKEQTREKRQVQALKLEKRLTALSGQHMPAPPDKP